MSSMHPAILVSAATMKLTKGGDFAPTQFQQEVQRMLAQANQLEKDRCGFMTKTPKSVPTHQLFRRQGNGEEIFVYEALTELECEGCKGTIKAYELFSRSADKKGRVYGIRYEQCFRCVPFKRDSTTV